MQACSTPAKSSSLRRMVGDFDLRHTGECNAIHASFARTGSRNGGDASGPSAQSSASLAPALPAAFSSASAPKPSNASQSRVIEINSSDDEASGPAPARKPPQPMVRQGSAQTGGPQQNGPSGLLGRSRAINGRPASKPIPALQLNAGLHANLRKNPLSHPSSFRVTRSASGSRRRCR